MSERTPEHEEVLRDIARLTRYIALHPLEGKVLEGYCNGYFGRESYGDKTIEAVGEDWVVVREKGHPNFATFDDSNDKINMLLEWFAEGGAGE